MYKPSPQYRGVARSLEMQECTHNVYRALKEFEKTFEKLIESP
jgi:NAD(P)H-dependent FMN reductase